MTSDLDYARKDPADLEPGDTPPSKPMRLWPILLVIAAYWAFHVWWRNAELVMFVRFGTTFLTAILVALVFVGWWLVSRRVPRALKWPAFGAFVAGGAATALLADRSIHPMTLLLLAPPWIVTAWAVCLLATRNVSLRNRRIALVATIIPVWGYYTLIRLDGLSGEQRATVSWRWSPSLEARYLAQRGKAAPPATRTTAATLPTAATDADWPGLRGPRRDGVARGVTIATDWPADGPRLAWRHPSGPGWSSFAIVGDRAYTQEQRGEKEAVVCFDVRDGSEIWAHLDNSRFYESVAGAGPRATPTFVDGRLYTMGGTGRLNCLDAADGRVIWTRDVRAHADAPLPQWGFSSSPLVAGGAVVVYAGGPGDKGVVAFRADTGEPMWSAPAGPHSYVSPHLATLAGREQILFLSDTGLTSLDAATGAPLWQFAAAAKGAPRSLQPQPVGTNQVLFASEMDIGTALLDVTADGTTWSANRKWASRGLKPSFNDSVVHNGHVYGFDGTVFTCLDLATGKRAWRNGNYGHGQVVLIEDQSMLVIVTEEGDVILRPARPDAPEEQKRFKAVEGKVWAHLAISRGRLIVRSDRETACFDLGGR